MTLLQLLPTYLNKVWHRLGNTDLSSFAVFVGYVVLYSLPGDPVIGGKQLTT